MKAIVFDGKSLRFDARAADPQPAADEAIIEVIRAGICATDLEIVRGYMGFTGILGHEFVGRVKRGPADWMNKRVVGEINCVCGRCDLCRRGLSRHCRDRTVLGILGRDGAFAQFLRLPVDNLHAVPDAVSDEEAVFVEPLAAAIQIRHQLPIDKQMHVTVIGPGRLGLLIAQVMAATGCKLDVVGRSETGLNFCERMGIQPLQVDAVVPKADRDVVVECTGSPDGFALATAMLRPRGTLVLKSTYAGDPPMNLAPVVINELTVLGSRCGPFPDAINALARREVEVASMVSRVFELSRFEDAFKAARDSRFIKIQFQVS